MNTIILATTLHDPVGRLRDQTARVLPVFQQLFGRIAVQATHTTQRRTLSLLEGVGALIRIEEPREASYPLLGRPRREALELGVQIGASHMLFCDFDRALHWAEFHPDELAAVVQHIPNYDFVVFGRTERAFNSHPPTQRDTESVVNHVFEVVSGLAWDVTAAARGVSLHGAEKILRDNDDESIGTDVSWPLFLRGNGFNVGYIATEGLEFETGDRFPAEVAAAGGLHAWTEAFDSNVQEWVQRLEIARVEVAAALPYRKYKHQD